MDSQKQLWEARPRAVTLARSRLLASAERWADAGAASLQALTSGALPSAPEAAAMLARLLRAVDALITADENPTPAVDALITADENPTATRDPIGAAAGHALARRLLEGALVAVDAPDAAAQVNARLAVVLFECDEPAAARAAAEGATELSHQEIADILRGCSAPTWRPAR